MTLVAFVFCLLAAIGWAAAWQTMHWLGQAEDLIEQLRDRLTEHDLPWGPRLLGYVRRTPRRPS